jgi:hypothetical protein
MNLLVYYCRLKPDNNLNMSVSLVCLDPELISVYVRPMEDAVLGEKGASMTGVPESGPGVRRLPLVFLALRVPSLELLAFLSILE